MTDTSGETADLLPLQVRDWEVDVTADGPLLIVSGEGRRLALRFAAEDLPEVAAGLLRLADHLRRRPPCGAVENDPR